MNDTLPLSSPDGNPDTRKRSNYLLLTKLCAPRAASDDVIRPRLLDEIERGADRKLTLLITPAGYGKSTLLSRWQTYSERASGWLSLDAGDNDIFVFVEYLVAAIQSIDPDICQQTSALLEAANPPTTQQLIQVLLNEVSQSTRPFVLILDDYHVISSPEVRSAVLQIIQGMPVNMAIVISSRHEPELPTLRMSARGELVELGFEDLSFSGSESAEFLLGSQGLVLTAADVEKITNWAEGWPVAMRLISRLLRGRSEDQVRALLESLSDTVPSLSNYLWDDVLADIPAEKRAFLLQTSILRQFNPDLAAAVTRNENAAELLQRLARDNLFISRLGGPGNWYRYHHLFADVLRQRLLDEESESFVLALNARAADWYEQHDQFTEAATHAIAAQEWGQAARLLIDICQEFYDQERIGSLRTWLGGLPDEPFLQEPRLAHWLAWALMRSGHVRRAARLIEISSTRLTGSDDPTRTQTALQLNVLKSIYDWDVAAGEEGARTLLANLDSASAPDRVRILVMLALLQQTKGNLNGAAVSLEEARALNGRIGLRGLQVLELNASGGLFRAMGKLKESADLYRRVITIGDEWNDLPVQYAHNQLGSMYYEWGRPDEARAQALTAIELSNRVDTPIQLPGAHALLATIACKDGDWNLALDEIERSIKFCATVEAWGPLRTYEERQCRIWLAAGQLTLAQHWLQQLGQNALESTSYADMSTTLTAIRVRIHEGRCSEVIERLEILRDLASENGWNFELLSIQTLLAIAEHERGDQISAGIAIESALEIGAADGFLRSYLDEGPIVMPVLKLAAQEDGPQRNQAIAVLAATGEHIPAARPASADGQPILSNRERDVMRLVANGLSNRAVGDTLFISEETVKTHLRRIFEKLDVTSRTQAIHKLQTLGLL